MEEERFENLLRFFKVLADESRLKIIGVLANRECSVDELASILGLQAPTISHHLAKLRSIGLCEMRKEGTTHIYRLDVECLARLSREYLASDKVLPLAAEMTADAWEKKVLASFTDQGGSITNIPVSPKKRVVVLKWLASQFEPGVRYREKEVNEILKQYHSDFATLRRELVDFGFMMRSQGVYWLNDKQK